VVLKAEGPVELAPGLGRQRWTARRALLEDPPSNSEVLSVEKTLLKFSEKRTASKGPLGGCLMDDEDDRGCVRDSGGRGRGEVEGCVKDSEFRGRGEGGFVRASGSESSGERGLLKELGSRAWPGETARETGTLVVLLARVGRGRGGRGLDAEWDDKCGT
jgi:hypothetical protein